MVPEASNAISAKEGGLLLRRLQSKGGSQQQNGDIMAKKKTNSRTTRTKKVNFEEIPDVRHTLTFPEDLWDALRAEAVAHGEKANALLRRILAARYRDISSTPPGATL
jgi:hypothetical protein